MSRILVVVVGGLIASMSSTQWSSAFTTQPISPETTNNRLADPDELADRMSNGQSGGPTIFGVPGGQLRLQFSGPSSRDTASSPFVTSPSTVFVPSEHR